MMFQRVVLDTNILVSALMTPSGNPASVYRMFISREIVLVYSEEIMREYEDVLYRPRLKISAEDAYTILKAIQQYGELVAPPPSTEALADEDDRVFYDAARTVGAYLITGNTRHYPPSSFILTPKEFLEL